MFDAKYCENICIGYTVRLNNVPTNVTLFFRDILT